MKKIIMLTQDNCGKCIVLDEYLKNGLNDQYKDIIKVVHMGQDPKLFMSLARTHGVMATPALIAGDHALLDPNPSNTQDFIEENL